MSEAILQSGITKFAVIDAASGDTAVVAAVTGKKIRVISYTLVGGGAATARFESGAGGTALTGSMLLAGSTVVSETCLGGLFETAAGAALSLELSASTADGHLTYIEV